MDQDRIIERIRKLLRLSQSANPHEAALAAERVQQMLSEYNLTMDSIGCDAETTSTRQVNRKTRKVLEKWAYALASRTARVFDCKYYHDPNTGGTSFVGVGVDPEVCGWMYGYLYKTLLRLASEHMRGPARRRKIEARGSELFSFRRGRRDQQSNDCPEESGSGYIRRSGSGQRRPYSGSNA